MGNKDKKCGNKYLHRFGNYNRTALRFWVNSRKSEDAAIPLDATGWSLFPRYNRMSIDSQNKQIVLFLLDTKIIMYNVFTIATSLQIVIYERYIFYLQSQKSMGDRFVHRV